MGDMMRRAKRASQEAATIVNYLLDREMRRRGITSDSALADALRTSQPNISRWRRGQIGLAARLLLPMMAAAPLPSVDPPAAPSSEVVATEA